MRDLARLLNDMTLDADVLVAIPSSERLDVLGPIYEFCARKGYLPEGEAIRVGAWPAQFIPVFSKLTIEAVQQADNPLFEDVPFRVVRAEHLAVIALSVGRPKDLTRILALLESGSVTRAEIASVAQRHGLADAWKRFEARFLDG